MRSAAAQAAVSAGVAVTGAAVHQLLPQRRGEPLRRAVVRNAGRRAVMVGGAGVVVSTAAYLDAAAHHRSRALGALSSGCGLLVGAAFAAQRIHRFRTDDPEEDARLAPPVDPLHPGRRRHADDRPEPAAAAATRPQPRPGHGGQRRAPGPGVRGELVRPAARRRCASGRARVGTAGGLHRARDGVRGQQRRPPRRHRVRQPQGRGRRRRHRRGVHDAAEGAHGQRRPDVRDRVVRRCPGRACASSTSR